MVAEAGAMGKEERERHRDRDGDRDWERDRDKGRDRDREREREREDGGRVGRHIEREREGGDKQRDARVQGRDVDLKHRERAPREASPVSSDDASSSGAACVALLMN